MVVAIVGSRTFCDYELLKLHISYHIDPSTITRIVSGGAKGADTLAEQYAKELNVPLEVFLPDWQRLGKVAGFIRNKKIVEASDIVFAFWDGKSHGTSSSINISKALNKPLHVIQYNQNNLTLF